MSQPIPPLDSKLTGALADSGTGALLGFSAGFAVKKVGKVAVFLVGMGFVGVQVAAERGASFSFSASCVSKGG